MSKAVTYEEITKLCPSIVNWEKELDSFSISHRDVHKFFNIYSKVAKDLDSCSVSSLVSFFDIESTTVLHKILCSISLRERGNARIDFSEFVVSLWSFCSCSQSMICKPFHFLFAK